MPDRKPEKVTLEDLLQLKRAERPPAEFWTRFEQELRAKQLAAIVEKRPWWQGLSRTWVRFSLPVGAAAALAFVLVQEHNFAPGTARVSPPVAGPAVAVVSAAPADPLRPALAAVRPVTTLPAVAIAMDHPTAAAPGLPEPVPVPAVSAPPAALVSWASTASPEELSIANYLNASGGLDPSRFLPPPPAKIETGPVGDIPANPVALAVRDQKLAQLLPRTDETAPVEAASAAQVHERISRRLSEDLLYASVHRIGLYGDRVTVKF